MNEDYVSFETAKLLKEKGFNEPVYRGISINNLIFVKEEPEDFNHKLSAYCSQPTLQMAMKWLREVHHITIGITFSLDIITYEIQKDEEFITAIGSSRSYEDMVEEAIKYCLNLI